MLAQVSTAPSTVPTPVAGAWKWPAGGSSGQAIGTTRSTNTPAFSSAASSSLQPGLVDRGDPGRLAGDGERRDREVDVVGVFEQRLLDHADRAPRAGATPAPSAR